MRFKTIICVLTLFAGGLYASDGHIPTDDEMRAGGFSVLVTAVHGAPASEDNDELPAPRLEYSQGFYGGERTGSGRVSVHVLERNASGASSTSTVRSPVGTEQSDFMIKHPFCDSTRIQWDTHRSLNIFLADIVKNADAEQCEQIIRFLRGISSRAHTQTPISADRLVELLIDYPHETYTIELVFPHIQPHVPTERPDASRQVPSD